MKNYTELVTDTAYRNVDKKFFNTVGVTVWSIVDYNVFDTVLNNVWRNVYENVNRKIWYSRKLFQNNYLQQYKDNV
jgi:hypothetical protein